MMDVASDGSVVMINHSTFVTLSIDKKADVDWAMEAEIAATTTELAFDAISTVLESKMRSSGVDSWSTWNCLQNCLRNGTKSLKENAEIIELNFLKRVVSLVLQRLARSSESWSGGILKGVVNIFTFVENRRLCGNLPHTAMGTKRPPVKVRTSVLTLF